MPEVISEKPAPYDVMPNRLRWTAQQCDALRDAGFLTDRYELIDGDIISKMGQKPRHAVVVNLIMTWLVAIFSGARVRVQSTIEISASGSHFDEPEPDLVVTANDSLTYSDHHPESADILLLIEVSDTTLRFDLVTKALIYSRAEIEEYWVVDVTDMRIYVHRQPTHEGYTDVRVYSSDETVAPLCGSDAPVLVADLLPVA